MPKILNKLSINATQMYDDGLHEPIVLESLSSMSWNKLLHIDIKTQHLPDLGEDEDIQ